jgi:hypothetical protein
LIEEIDYSENVKTEHVSSLVAAIQQTKDVFTQRKIEKLPEAFKMLQQHIDEVSIHQPIALYVFLNMQSKHLSFLGNTILKLMLWERFVAKTANLTPKTQHRLSLSLFITLYAIAPRILQIKKQNLVLVNFEQYCRQAFLNSLRISEHVFLDDKDLIDVFVSLSNNDVSSGLSMGVFKSQFFLVLEATFLTCPISLQQALNANDAIVASFYRPRTFLSKKYNAYLDHSIVRRSYALLQFGQLVRLYNESTAVLLNQSSDNDSSWLVAQSNGSITSGEYTTALLENNKIRFRYVQPKIDAIEVIALLSNNENVKNAFVTLDSEPNIQVETTKGFLAPSKNVWAISKLLLTEKTNLIIDALNDNQDHRLGILNYAQQVSREKLPIHSLPHAIALLGVARVFPVVLINELKIGFNQNDHLFSALYIVKADEFATLCRSVSRVTGVDLPEYMELIGRVLFMTFVNTQDLDATKGFEQRALAPWYKQVKTFGENWQLPKLYRGALESYFAIKTNKKNINEIAKSVRAVVAALMVSEWFYERFQNGTELNELPHINTDLLSALGINYSELPDFYNQIQANVYPHCPFC